MDDKTSRYYAIFVPRSEFLQGRPPVLLFLNGEGQNGNDGLRQISNNFGVQTWENREFFPFIAIAPQCRVGGSWVPGSLDTRIALQILDHVIKEFNADPDRVYLTGVSSGASGVWSIASAHPDRFAAILPLCGEWDGDTNSLSTAQLPIWNVYNSGDRLELVSLNRTIRRQLIEQGHSPLVTEFDAGGHDCWNRGYRTAAVYQWLLEQRRSKNQQALQFQSYPAKRILEEWRLSAPGSWSSGDDDVLIGRGDETNDRGELIGETASTAIEIHSDVLFTEETECRVGFLAEDSSSKSWWISIVLADLGTGGVASSDSEWRGRLDPAAQHTLRPNAWNDVRVELTDGRIRVRLNGWPALDVAIESTQTGTVATKYRCALATPEDDSEIQWRFIRARFDTGQP